MTKQHAVYHTDQVDPVFSLHGMKQISLMCLSLFFILGCGATQSHQISKIPAHSQAPSPTSAPVFILVGDSTVTNRAGWGQGFGSTLINGATYHNAAAGGRSAKSYRDEGLWEKRVVPNRPHNNHPPQQDAEHSDQHLNPPTYVLIQFGHNDQPGKGPKRETLPSTTYRDYLRQYIKDAQQLGMQPVLVSSMSRRRFKDNGEIQTSLTPWADATKIVAVEMNVPVIDLHTISLHVFENLGLEGCIPLEPPKQSRDYTHLNQQGALLIGPMVAAELARVCPEVAPYIQASPIPVSLRQPIYRPMAEELWIQQ